MLACCFLLVVIFGKQTTAQGEYVPEWQSTGDDWRLENLRIHAALQTPDGGIQLVGSGKSPSGDLDSYLATLDPATGKIEKDLTLPSLRSGDDELLAVCAGSIGGIWLAGYTTSYGEHIPRLLRMDYNKEIDSIFFEEIRGSRFTQVVALKDGRVILCAEPDNLKRETVRFYEYDNRRLTELFRLRPFEAMTYNVVAIQPKPSGAGFYIVVNNRATRKNRPNGTVSVIELSPELEVQSAKKTDRSSYYFAQSASVSPDGTLLLTGYTYRSGSDEPDLWAAKYNPDSCCITDLEVDAAAGIDAGWGIEEAPDGVPIVVNVTKKFLLGSEFEEISLWRGGDKLESRPIIVPDNYQLPTSIVATLMTYQGRYILIGNEEISRRETQPRLTSFAPLELLAEKGGRIECINQRIVFGDGDNSLSPGERLEIQFDIANYGTEGIWGLQVQVDAQLAPGIVLPYRAVNVLPIGAGQYQTVSIPLVAQNQLSVGQTFLRMQVVRQGEILAEVTQNFRSRVEGGRTIILVDHPTLKASRSLTTDQRSLALPVKVYSEYPLERENVKIRQNGLLLPRSKDMIERLERGLTLSNGLTESTINFQLDLADGANTFDIVVELPNGEITQEQITLTYRPKTERPNLHVLAIGPDYANFTNKGYRALKYNQNDVRDFSRLMALQENTDLYEAVFIDTLLTEAQTTQAEIEAALNKLYVRTQREWQQDYIGENDVIVLFFSGHGDVIDDDFYLIPSNFDPSASIAYSVDYKSIMRKYLNKLDRKAILFLDACRSGDASKGIDGASEASRRLDQLNEALPGIIPFQSCGPGENSYEFGDGIDNGVFSEALLEVLSGKTSDAGLIERLGMLQDPGQDGYLTLKELVDYTGARVPLLIREIGRNSKQKPGLGELNDKLKGNLDIDFFQVVRE